MPSTDTVSGEAWYVKSTGMPMLIFSTSVYYCPATSGKGPSTCIEALIHEEGAAPAPGASGSSEPEDTGYAEEEEESELSDY